MQPLRCGARSFQCALPGAASGRLDDLEILGAVGVGEDEQPVAVMLHLVLHMRVAALNEARRGGIVVEVENIGFRSFVILDLDDADAPRLGLPDAQKPAWIELLEQQFVFVRRRAEPVAEDLAGAVVLVHPHVIIAGRIRAPHDLAIGVHGGIGQVAPALDVAHADRVIFRAFHIDAPREQLMARGMRRRVEIEELFLFGQFLAIEHDRLALVPETLAANQRMFVADAIAAVIGERPVLRRRIGIVFLDARPHLLQERAAQAVDGF